MQKNKAKQKAVKALKGVSADTAGDSMKKDGEVKGGERKTALMQAENEWWEDVEDLSDEH
jgi:hypothetical protein